MLIRYVLSDVFGLPCEIDWEGPGYYNCRQHQTYASGNWYRWNRTNNPLDEWLDDPKDADAP